MLYGLVGTHRSGKTTLARQISEDLGIDFYEVSTSEVAREAGFDPVAPMSLRERVSLQAALLERMVNDLNALPRPLITDRTPIDQFGYLMAEFHMTSHLHTEPDVLEAANVLAAECLEATRLCFDMIFMLSPLQLYVVDNTKATPAPNPAFQTHHDALLRGAISRLHGDVNYAIVPQMDFEQRREAVTTHIVERMNEIDEDRHAAGMH